MYWLRGRHPQEPSDWRETVREDERRVSQVMRGRRKLKPAEVLFVDRWIDYKVTFSRQQKMKCGYCELSIAADANGGDIEHYRPKAQLTELLDDPNTWGQEIEGHNSRDPTKPRKVRQVGRGYWWLAYDWSNYLLSCGTCNAKWKGNLFPVKGGHQRAPTKKHCAKEEPLLLNPYGKVDPAEHLDFDRVGLISPLRDSPTGLATIQTCNLLRRSLQDSRCLVAKDAWVAIKAVLKELGRKPLQHGRLRRSLGQLLRLGSPSREHCGMVRIMWAHNNGFRLSWAMLQKLMKKLKE